MNRKLLEENDFLNLIKAHEQWLTSGGAEGKRLVLNKYMLPPIKLVEVNLSEAQFLRCVFSANTVFNGCIFSEAEFMKCRMSGALFFACEMRGVNFAETHLNFCDFSKSDLRGCSFDGADLSHADLRQARISDAAWPLTLENLTVNVDDTQVMQLLYHVVSNGLQSKHTSDSVKKLLATLVKPINNAVPRFDYGYAAITVPRLGPLEYPDILTFVRNVECWDDESIDKLVSAWIEHCMAYGYVPIGDHFVDLMRDILTVFSEKSAMESYTDFISRFNTAIRAAEVDNASV